jgi:Putative MetA-pathway of phenol degradation
MLPHTAKFKFIFLLLIFLVLSSPASGQIPFYTDDADTTPKGKFHIEFSNEHDWLQRSSLPGKRQNTSTFTLNYGLTDRIELGVNAPFIRIFNSRESRLRSPSGIGDMQFGVKIKLREERDESSLPAMTVVFYAEAPTGSTRKQLGSGLTDYSLYGVLQKSITKRTVARLNGGVLFAGNSSTGLIGIETVRGQVFTGNGSLVRDFSDKLKLGIEVFGGVTNDFNLSRGQLEAQIGGSYSLCDDFAFTFGVLGGRFPGSPRVGIHVGLAYDFE